MVAMMFGKRSRQEVGVPLELQLGFQIGNQVAVFSAGLVRRRGSLQLAMADPTALIGSLTLQWLASGYGQVLGRGLAGVLFYVWTTHSSRPPAHPITAIHGPRANLANPHYDGAGENPDQRPFLLHLASRWHPNHLTSFNTSGIRHCVSHQEGPNKLSERPTPTAEYGDDGTCQQGTDMER